MGNLPQSSGTPLGSLLTLTEALHENRRICLYDLTLVFLQDDALGEAS